MSEALESLKRVQKDIQLPLFKDTRTILLERLAAYYDDRGRDLREYGLIAGFFQDVLKVFKSLHKQIVAMVQVLQELDQKGDDLFNSQVASMHDTVAERVLIDKDLIGRREVESFLNGLLAPLWRDENWRAAMPVFTDAIKELVQNELSNQILELELDSTITGKEKKEKIEREIVGFVRDKLLDRLYPVDDKTGRRTEPTYTTPDGRSLLLEFASDSLVPLMVGHSVPLWFIHTHQLGSASQPIAFVGLNGSKVPDGLVDALRQLMPGFRTTDIALSDVEPRIVIKQYDPLYALASLAGIKDYENYYLHTDRKYNPMHTDVRFVQEPNAYLQWLSYKAPEEPPVEFTYSVAATSAENGERKPRQLAHAGAQPSPAVAIAPPVTKEGGSAPKLEQPAAAAQDREKPSQILKTLHYFMCDRNADVVSAWKHFFGRGDHVEFVEGDILSLEIDSLIVPTNSFGIMDSGIARQVNKAANGKLQPDLRRMIQEEYSGEIPVGAAVVLNVSLPNSKLAVMSPVVRVPEKMRRAPTINPYLATRAALMVLAQFLIIERRKHGTLAAKTVAFTGMGTGSGGCPPAVAAFQMYEAFCQIVLGKEPNFATLESAVAHDQELKVNRFL